MDEAFWIARALFRDRSVQVSLLVAAAVLVPLSGVLAARLGWARSRVLAAGLAGGGLAGMLALTWGRWVLYDPDLRWRGCLFGSPLGAADGEALLNWLLMMPAAFFAMLALRRFAVVAALALALPVAVELVQSWVALGTCQTVDVVRNTGGGLVAAALASGVLALAGRSSH